MPSWIMGLQTMRIGLNDQVVNGPFGFKSNMQCRAFIDIDKISEIMLAFVVTSLVLVLIMIVCDSGYDVFDQLTSLVDSKSRVVRPI